MFKPPVRIIILIQKLFLLIFIYQLFRILFFTFNYSYFPGTSFSDFISICLYGIRFDLSAIMLTNIALIALHLIPLPFFYNLNFQRFLKVLFYIINIPAFLFNCIDLAYYQYTLKKTTWDVFTTVSLGEDFMNLLPQMIKDFWYVLLIFLTLILITEILYRRIKTSAYFGKENLLSSLASFIFFSSLTVVGARGGLQLRPLSILSAAQSATPQNVSLVLNTTFTLIKSVKSSELTEVNFFEKDNVSELYNTKHFFEKEKAFRNLNVVIIILESFSNEFIGSANDKGFTPFLDSLSKESLVLRNSYANGRKTIEGIPAIIAGIPQLMNNPYITSAYSSNKFQSIANILKSKDYNTSFYHGGTNGTMGFDNFTKMAGFDHYFGRTEYANDKDFDGKWGIFDEDFFQFFAKNLNNTPQPFFSCFFSLSSHHPYIIPEKHRNKFKEGLLPIHKCIRYTDYALQSFFAQASKMSWFENTLFIITADHTTPAAESFYQNRVGMYSIPIILYNKNSDLKGTSYITSQQIDILPSVLDYLNYDREFFSFGKSIFDSTETHFAFNYLNGIYQIISDDYCLQFDGVQSIGLYNYARDSSLSNNLINTDIKKKIFLEERLKAVIQTYNYSMIHNELVE